jgi:hypothetical protein
MHKLQVKNRAPSSLYCKSLIGWRFRGGNLLTTH